MPCSNSMQMRKKIIVHLKIFFNSNYCWLNFSLILIHLRNLCRQWLKTLKRYQFSFVYKKLLRSTRRRKKHKKSVFRFSADAKHLISMRSKKRKALTSIIFLKKSTGFFQKNYDWHKRALVLNKKKKLFFKKKKLRKSNKRRKRRKYVVYWKKNFLDTWRLNRNYWKLVYGYRFRRHKFLTRYLQKMTKVNLESYLLNLELSVANIMFRTKLCFSLAQYNDMVFFKYVYVNGKLLYYKNKSLKVGESVQLILSNSYYKYYIYNKLLLRKKLFKIKYYLWRYSKNRYHQKDDEFKPAPGWMLRLQRTASAGCSYVEIDYRTFSVTVIKMPKYRDYTPHHFFYNSWRLFKNLNWKYIT